MRLILKSEPRGNEKLSFGWNTETFELITYSGNFNIGCLKTKYRRLINNRTKVLCSIFEISFILNKTYSNSVCKR